MQAEQPWPVRTKHHHCPLYMCSCWQMTEQGLHSLNIKVKPFELSHDVFLSKQKLLL